MAIGFDYGTANCSVAHMVSGEVESIPLHNGEFYIGSTLCAPSSEAVTEYLFRHWNIKPFDTVGENLLRRAIRENTEEGLEIRKDDILFGQKALDLYLESPQDVYYIKSPKSFLGSIGLRDVQLSFFEDLVCSMMVNIKSQAESHLQENIEQTVIGRPVNFMGLGGEESNQQAEGILKRAALRAGFKDIEFQFEPVAAGLDYEATLSQDKLVLVVDIGGGTTDCSLLKMGPSWATHFDRSESLLGHTGQRVGGNDLDIHLAFKRLMADFGMGSQKVSGLDMPMTQFWNPIAINDVQAQRKFYGFDNVKDLKMLYKEAKDPEKLARLMQVQRDSLGYRIVREAEKSKIQLGEHETHQTSLIIGKETISRSINRQELDNAIESSTAKIQALVKEAVVQAQVKPDVIYMTGGSARSPILQKAVRDILPNIEVVSGNYFGSVTAGLARWADLCFK
ncbi:molecular chaperone [Vibrio sp.]|nr:molecular chaperone [Vibrio sp.]